MGHVVVNRGPIRARIEKEARHPLPNRTSAIASPVFVTVNVIRTGSPGRYPSLSALTDAVSPEMGLRGPNRGDGAKTRTADRRMMPATMAAARRTQPVLVGRTPHPDASGS